MSVKSVPLPERAPEGTPLYVHLPFCATKCHYCDFFSLPALDQDIDGLIESVLAEAERRAPTRPRTVFLGGGTPSLLDVAQLTRLLDRLDELTDFRSTAVEVSAECNPESLDRDKASALLDLGVRRLSIGFQSLADETLALLGRAHSAHEAFRAYDAARAAGVAAVSVDLMYALPGQTPAEWERDLQRVLALEPDHLSAYNLTYEKGTRFHLLRSRGRLEQTPEESELEMLAAARELCATAGLTPYEISNYARPGAECRHNVNYWRNGPYVGLGPSAVSKVGDVRAGNARGLSAYRARIDTGGDAITWSECLEPLGRLVETWWLGLRLAAGVLPEEARATAGFAEPLDPALGVAARLEAAGLLEARGDRFVLSERGLPLADALAREFLALAVEGREVGAAGS